MTSIPELSNLPIIARRYIEAAILKNVFDEIERRFDRETAEQIIGQACSNSAVAHGKNMEQQVDHPANLQDFAEILPNWTKEDALEIEVLEQNKSTMDFNVTRCRYAEMYEEHFHKPINQIVILIVTEEGTTQVFKKDKKEFLPKLEESVKQFYDWIEKNGKSN